MREQLPTGHFVWKALQSLLPRTYRERYGRELLRLHVERSQRPGGFVFWCTVAFDVLLTAAQLRFDALRGRASTASSSAGVFDSLRHSLKLARRSVLHAP